MTPTAEERAALAKARDMRDPDLPEEEWEDVTGSLFSWDKVQVGTLLKGEYIGYEERASAYRRDRAGNPETTRVYTLKREEGITSFFVPTVLDTILKRCIPGQFVRIEYIGDKPNRNPHLNPIKQFKVQVRKGVAL